ncbi:hypothetical protein ACFQPA_15480 [Halomarina halobia]|uniref:DUF7982 domain-containing protein n=1 Tax=Halomarina halobia TaxID=3033386 RepID=A0ABD6A7H1_9EURY|nr:hypothetical protein [Halomarina sp. PSR21]
MSVEADGATDARGGDPTDAADAEELAVRVELLAAENRRLREAYRDAMRTRYRQTAIAFGAIGALALLGGAFFPGSRTVLYALGGTGVFAGVLTYFLTPERFIPARIGEAVYRTLADDVATIVGELELSNERVYVPRSGDARLFVPQFASYDVPADEDLDTAFVLAGRGEERGLALTPTGLPLAEFFEDTLDRSPGDAASLAPRLASALVDQFELVERAEADVDARRGRVSVGVAGPAYDPVDSFDNPIASLVAVAVARTLQRPISLSVVEPDDERYDALVVCSWEAAEDEAAGDGSPSNAEAGTNADAETDGAR